MKFMGLKHTSNNINIVARQGHRKRIEHFGMEIKGLKHTPKTIAWVLGNFS
jgi:hypothetical protein